MADEVIVLGPTRYTYHRVENGMATITAITEQTNMGGVLAIPVADARSMWAGLRAAERYQRLARTPPAKDEGNDPIS